MGKAQRYFSQRIGAYYGAIFFVYGISVPYLSVYLDARGLTAAEIGILSSVPLFLRLILTPGLAMHADRSGDYRGMTIALTFCASAALAVAAGVSGFWALLLTVTAFQVALQSSMPLIETIAMDGVKVWGADYGRMRLCGSVTFILAAVVASTAVERFGPGSILWLLFFSSVATLGIAFGLPKSHPADETVRRGLNFSAASALISSPMMLLFLIACGSVQSAHAVYYAFGVLHWRETGIAAGWIGTLWSIGVVVEIALFWCSAGVLRRLAPAELICVGAASAVIRWSVTAFDPPVLWLLPLQLLHGLTYGATHLGAMHFIRQNVPQDQSGTAQALYSTVTASLGMGLALWLAGYAYARFAGASYLAMAVLALAGLAAGLLLRQRITLRSFS